MNSDIYTEEHILMFGHAPITDLKTGRRCIHPMHDAMATLMNAPGVDLEIEFSPHEIIGEDDPIAVADREDYEKVVQEYRDGIKRIEEEDERKARGKTQF